MTDEAPNTYEDEDQEDKGLSTSVKERPKYPIANEGGSYLNNFYKIDNPYVKAMISIPQSCIVPSRVI